MRFTTTVRRGIRALSLTTLVVAIASCMQELPSDQVENLQTDAAMPRAASGFEDHARRGVSLGGASVSKQSAGTPAARPNVPGQVPPSGTQVAADGMIIRNGHVSVQVDSLEIAIEGVRQLAASLGGNIGNVSINTGERQIRGATLEMKIPAARFDDAMTGVSPLGKVEQRTATAQDVGEEFVDLSARVANARRLEARLLALLAARTGKLEDVLAVERELARVREEIERYEGRLRYLGSRVATSTIVAMVHEKAPLVATTPGTNVIANAFINMWRNFVAFVALAIEALGVAVPVAAIAWLLVWRWRRFRTSSAVAST